MFEPDQRNMVPPCYHEGPYQDEFLQVVGHIEKLCGDHDDALAIAADIVDGNVPWITYHGSKPY